MVYINDKVNDISSGLRLFVDDTCLFVSAYVYNPLMAAITINADLKQV